MFKLTENKAISKYAIVLSVIGQLIFVGSPSAVAQDRMPLESSNLALSSITTPVGSEAQAEEDELVLQNDLFVQPPCVYDGTCTPVQKSDSSITQAKKRIAVSNMRVIVTAYSSTLDQTDSSPFITANGTFVSDGVLACNFLPFGAKVKLPEYSGDKIYVVNDRMAKKNDHKMDIWMESREIALQFGVKHLAVEIVK